MEWWSGGILPILRRNPYPAIPAYEVIRAITLTCRRGNVGTNRKTHRILSLPYSITPLLPYSIFRFRQGKRKPERCPLCYLAFHPNSPAIAFRQFLTQHQSHTGGPNIHILSPIPDKILIRTHLNPNVLSNLWSRRQGQFLSARRTVPGHFRDSGIVEFLHQDAVIVV